MKIAVIGAGIFGITSALKLREKFPAAKIVIWDKNISILKAASGINQYRLHRGYHYPRSNETVDQVLNSVLEFEEYFSKSILKNGFSHYYGISKYGSKITTNQYIQFLESNDLPYEVVQTKKLPLHYDKIDVVVKVVENGFDIADLHLQCIRKLRESNIELKLGFTFEKADFESYDLVINATYSNINHLLGEDSQQDYQFELCEKAVVSIGREYRKMGIVILDGDFCCIDPLGREDYFHVLGHVKEAIHNVQIGKNYVIPNGYSKILNFGILKSPLSRFPFILRGCEEYFKFEGYPIIPAAAKRTNPLFGNVYYHGSMFTIRTVLPNRDHDDARPSSIIKHSDRFYSIFGGKIGTSVSIANDLIKQI